MRVEAVSKAYSSPLGSTSAEEVILGYKRVQGGFERDSVGKEATKEEESDVLNKVARYRPQESPANNHIIDDTGDAGGILLAVVTGGQALSCSWHPYLSHVAFLSPLIRLCSRWAGP
jgi:hypothetical protein